MYLELFFAHPLHRVIIHSADLVPDKEFLGCHHTVEVLRVSAGDDWLERDTCHCTW